MNTTPIATKYNLEVGKIYWFYNNDNYNSVCKGRILHILPDKYLPNKYLIVYEWYFRGATYTEWKYAVMSTDDFETWKYNTIKDVLETPRLKKQLKQGNIKWR